MYLKQQILTFCTSFLSTSTHRFVRKKFAELGWHLATKLRKTSVLADSTIANSADSAIANSADSATVSSADSAIVSSADSTIVNSADSANSCLASWWRPAASSELLSPSPWPRGVAASRRPASRRTRPPAPDWSPFRVTSSWGGRATSWAGCRCLATRFSAGSVGRRAWAGWWPW